VQDVLFNKSLIPLEKAMAKEGITGETAEDAIIFLKSRRNMHMTAEEILMSNPAHHLAVHMEIAKGSTEVQAILKVAKGVTALYKKASGELEAGLAEMDSEAAMNARCILRYMYGRRLQEPEFNRVTQEQLSSVNAKMDGGKSEADAIIETVREARPQKLRAELLADTFSRLAGFGKEDIKPLIELIGKYEKQGYVFAGPMGSKLSFGAGGDYDLVFMGTRTKVPEPAVLQDKVGARGTQVEVILIPDDLRPTETTYVKSQPIAYPLLMNSLAMNEQALRLMANLKAQIPPAEVATWYTELSRSILNIDGYTRPDLWSSTAAEGKTVRYDFDVLMDDASKTERAATAFRRCCLDFFPRAMYLREFNEFPNEAVAENTVVYDNMFRQIQASNPGLAQPLKQMHDLGLHIIKARIMSLGSSTEINAEVAKLAGKAEKDVRVRDLETLCPDGLSVESMGRVREFLSAKEKESAGKAPSKSVFRDFRLLVLRELRNTVGGLMKTALDKARK
jgi:hypothetical protein